MLRTRLTEACGLEVPILSAGMAFVATPALAAAVSNAGGMGFLGGAMVPPEGLTALVRDVRARTTRPFGVDLVTEFVEDAHVEACAAGRVPVVVFFWGAPCRRHVERLKAAGTRVWMQVGSVAEARQAADLGLDAVIVQGQEGAATTAPRPACSPCCRRYGTPSRRSR